MLKRLEADEETETKRWLQCRAMHWKETQENEEAMIGEMMNPVTGSSETPGASTKVFTREERLPHANQLVGAGA
jgi:hypothetical protein